MERHCSKCPPRLGIVICLSLSWRNSALWGHRGHMLAHTVEVMRNEGPIDSAEMGAGSRLL